jgi:hypothetical protein
MTYLFFRGPKVSFLSFFLSHHHSILLHSLLIVYSLFSFLFLCVNICLGTAFSPSSSSSSSVLAISQGLRDLMSEQRAKFPGVEVRDVGELLNKDLTENMASMERAATVNRTKRKTMKRVGIHGKGKKRTAILFLIPCSINIISLSCIPFLFFVFNFKSTY